jgi:hypothetical protein
LNLQGAFFHNFAKGKALAPVEAVTKRRGRFVAVPVTKCLRRFVIALGERKKRLDMNKFHVAVRLVGILFASGFAVAVGCSSPGPERIDPRGNYPDVGTGNVDSRDTGGTLVISTPTEVDWSSGRTLTNGPDVRPPVVHTGYTVFNSEGAFVQYVPNHSLAPSADESPQEVVLPPGRYLVRADEAGAGHDRFWVTIDPERRTQVDVARIEMPREPEVR